MKHHAHGSGTAARDKGKPPTRSAYTPVSNYAALWAWSVLDDLQFKSGTIMDFGPNRKIVPLTHPAPPAPEPPY